MKAKYFTILLLLLAIGSCRKDNHKKKQVNLDIPVGTIVADIDGIKTTFNIEAMADTVIEQFDFYSKIFRLEISGRNNTLPNLRKINIKFWAKPVRVIDNGTYPDLDKQIYNYMSYIDIWTYSINTKTKRLKGLPQGRRTE